MNYYQNKQFYYSTENKKLIPSADTNFMIWNLPCRITCPYATAGCLRACYARKAELAYPDAKPSRLRNLEFAKRADFAETMAAVIRRRYKGQRKPRLIVRVHESGDFFSEEYADAWLNVARALLDLRGVEFIAYTKSFPYFDGKALPENFHLRASVWDDTRPEFLDMISRNAWPIYTAVERFTNDDAFHQCRCEDCATCGKCWSSVPMIACEIH